MAITYCPNGNMIGLSTDRAAITGPVPGGTLFTETDTGDVWIRVGSSWQFLAGGGTGINIRTLNARVATTANQNIASAPATLDNKALVAGDIVLLAGQTTASQNGLYVFAAAASPLTRAAAYDDGTEVHGGDIVTIDTGDAFGGDAFVLALDGAATVGTTSLPFRSLATQRNATNNSATPGATTINQPAGKAAIALGASSVVVTNSLVTAASMIFVTPIGAAPDATLTGFRVNPGAGSFTVTGNANAAAAWPFSFLVVNP